MKKLIPGLILAIFISYFPVVTPVSAKVLPRSEFQKRPPKPPRAPKPKPGKPKPPPKPRKPPLPPH